MLRSAGAMVELSDLDRYYGNAIAIVCVHAMIAYNDALTVAFAGVKSTEGEHARAADVLQSALGPRAPPEMVKLLRSLLTLKDRVSYQGQYYTAEEAVRLFGRVEEFCAWAERMYQERP
ncbi:MAG: hypothetical protein WD766_02670 [Gemmatimonadota bacterium]